MWLGATAILSSAVLTRVSYAVQAAVSGAGLGGYQIYQGDQVTC